MSIKAINGESNKENNQTNHQLPFSQRSSS
jgi:hypothetical protein